MKILELELKESIVPPNGGLEHTFNSSKNRDWTYWYNSEMNGFIINHPNPISGRSTFVPMEMVKHVHFTDEE